MNKNIKNKLLLACIMALSLTACVSDDYQFGDISTAYCSSTTIEGRALIKGQLTAIGIEVPFNYCATVGLVDMMLTNAKVE